MHQSERGYPFFNCTFFARQIPGKDDLWQVVDARNGHQNDNRSANAYWRRHLRVKIPTRPIRGKGAALAYAEALHHADIAYDAKIASAEAMARTKINQPPTTRRISGQQKEGLIAAGCAVALLAPVALLFLWNYPDRGIGWIALLCVFALAVMVYIDNTIWFQNYRFRAERWFLTSTGKKIDFLLAVLIVATCSYFSISRNSVFLGILSLFGIVAICIYVAHAIKARKRQSTEYARNEMTNLRSQTSDMGAERES